MRPLVRLFGRHWNPYSGTDRLDQFIDRAQRTWPDATVVLIPPFPFAWTYRTSWPIVDRVMDDYRALAARRGLPFLHLTSLGDDNRLRNSNGYNLNVRGSEIVGEELARWILAELAVAEPAAAAVHAA
jgi:hypothetical protein